MELFSGRYIGGELFIIERNGEKFGLGQRGGQDGQVGLRPTELLDDDGGPHFVDVELYGRVMFPEMVQEIGNQIGRNRRYDRHA